MGLRPWIPSLNSQHEEAKYSQLLATPLTLKLCPVAAFRDVTTVLPVRGASVPRQPFLLQPAGGTLGRQRDLRLATPWGEIQKNERNLHMGTSKNSE